MEQRWQIGSIVKEIVKLTSYDEHRESRLDPEADLREKMAREGQ